MNESPQECNSNKMYLWMTDCGLISKIAMLLRLDQINDQHQTSKKITDTIGIEDTPNLETLNDLIMSEIWMAKHGQIIVKYPERFRLRLHYKIFAVET